MSFSPKNLRDYRQSLADECIDRADRVRSTDGQTEINLDEHQSEAMEKTVYALGKNQDKFSIVHPCGSGKTVLEATLLQASQAAKMKLGEPFKNTQDLLLTVERSIVENVRDHIKTFGLDAGIWSMGEKTLDRPILVTNIQALQVNQKNLKKHLDPKKVNLILGDESDKFLTQKRQALLDLFPYAQRIGFTATPEWPDGRHLSEAWGDIIHELSLREGIKTGIVTPPLFTLYQADFNSDEVEMQGGDYEKKSLEAALKAVEIELAIPEVYKSVVPEGQRKQWPTLVYVPSIGTVERTVEALKKEFPELVVTSWTGDMADGRLKQEIQDFQNGKIDLLVLCEMGGRGLNLPRARLLIDAYPTTSANKLEQRHARVLRKVRADSNLSQDFRKPFAHVAQVLPKSNAFRPVTLLDILDCVDAYKPDRVLDFQGGGDNGGDVGRSMQEEVNQIVGHIRKNPKLTAKLTLLENVDILREIRLLDDIPMEDEEGFIYTEK
ncbi:DEAD/DEAH box helicase family protein [Candidatus Peregrinibacteria bacterium]|nr:DEAD/DEAH box helicase family protein [Candidatus Peregrinibacteria bacterium]